MSDPTWDYMTGQMHDTHPGLLAAFQAESDAAVEEFSPELDLAYGAHARARFDVFRSAEPARATIVYFHAGYWQSRDKAMFRFLARPWRALGFDVVLVNYPLCPDVTFAEVVAAARAAVPAVMRHIGQGGFILMGHSAGAHLVMSILQSVDPAWPGNILGGVALSGVYDLVPLLQTGLNDRLGLTETEARQYSVDTPSKSKGPPVFFAVGELETPAFRRQNRVMAEIWTMNGNVSRVVEVPGCDHFSLLRAVTEDQTGINSFMLGL